MSVEIKYMDAQILGSTFSTLITLGVGGYVFKRWMDRREKVEDETRAEIKKDLQYMNEGTKHELHEIKVGIKEVADHVAIANGRTARLEGQIDSVKAVCAERHKGK